jgi:uncharacterized protein YndB with AHSA1/START domain
VRQIIGSSGPVYSSRTSSVVAPSPWHIVGDRSDATEVEITFTGAAERTTVRIVHTGWERLGAAGPEMPHRNRQGWAGLLDHYQEAAVGL